jgi:DNA-binding transcriptional regulator YdaS (Cro superfamily)
MDKTLNTSYGLVMSTIAPPSPKEELSLLCEFLGSQGAVARFIGREATQVSRWRKAEAEIRPTTALLIDGAWNAVCLISDIVGREEVRWVVHQRWPVLGHRSPAEFVREGRPDELISALREAAGNGHAVESTAVDEDDEIVAWLADSLDPTAAAAATPLERSELDDDEDDDEAAPARFSEAWRGGRAISSDRWFRS